MDVQNKEKGPAFNYDYALYHSTSSSNITHISALSDEADTNFRRYSRSCGEVS